MSLEIRCRAMAAGGSAVGRLPDGRVAFVGGAAAGELVEAEVEVDKGRFLQARAVRILEPSPDRVEPPCRHFGDCGGCSWQFLSYDAQLRAKVGILEDSLARLGGFAEWPGIEAVGPDSPWGGRNRAQFQPPSRPGAAWGFFAAGSRRTVELEECPILAPELQGVWNDLREVRSDRFSGRRDRSAFAWGGQGLRRLQVPGGPRSEPAEVLLDGRRLRFAPEGFFQSHLGLLPRMVREVVAEEAGNVAWDLYSGVGLFASRLEERFGTVHAVESDPLAALFAPGNLVRARHHAVAVEDWLEEAARSGSEPPDFVVVDPPRQGLSKRAMQALLANSPARIRYVSCGHDTFARDLRAFGSAGWKATRLVLLDLYPHTPHMEVVATLEPI